MIEMIPRMKQDLAEYIKSLKVTTSYRGNCPVCHNKNTFSVTKINEYLIFHCFHASCHTTGKVKNELSLDTIRNKSQPTTKSLPNFIEINDDCRQYLIDNHCIDAYNNSYADIRYDPKQNRCVFMLKDHKGVIKGAVGRALNSTLPKWFVYSRMEFCPFFCNGDFSAAILVEDCASACSASRHLCGIALLGTTLNTAVIPYLLPYSHLYIALDDDATVKAIEMQKTLALYKPTKIIPLRKDLKYFSDFELTQFLKRYLNE